MAKTIHDYNKEMDEIITELREGKIDLKVAKELVNAITKRTKQSTSSVAYHQLRGEFPVCEFLSLGNMQKITGPIEKEVKSISKPKLTRRGKKAIDWSLMGKSVSV